MGCPPRATTASVSTFEGWEGDATLSLTKYSVQELHSKTNMVVHFGRCFILRNEQLHEILDGERGKGYTAYPQSRFTQACCEDGVEGDIEEYQTPLEETISCVG